LHTLSIGWFGGEPLLEANRILEISRFAQEAAHNKGFHFKSHITTNGYLLNFDLFSQLVSAGVTSFQISFDGTEEEHNRTRRAGSSEGTFSTIMQNVCATRAHAGIFEIILRLHIHAANYESLISLIDDIGHTFDGDHRYKATVQKILNHGGARANPIKLASNDLTQKAEAYLNHRLSSFQVVNPNRDALLCCYASLPNHFIIRANGRIQKCTVALYDRRNDVGELLADGSINWYDQERIRAWSAGLFDGDLEKMMCPWKVMQRGGSSMPRSA
jgi:uncharacterized protein